MTNLPARQANGVELQVKGAVLTLVRHHVGDASAQAWTPFPADSVQSAVCSRISGCTKSSSQLDFAFLLLLVTFTHAAAANINGFCSLHHHLAALPAVPGQRVAGSPPTCYFDTEGQSQGRCQHDRVVCALVATSLWPSRLSYCAQPNQPSGPRGLGLAGTGAAVDYSVRTDHLQAGLLQACGLNVRTKDVAAHGVVPAGGLRKAAAALAASAVLAWSSAVPSWPRRQCHAPGGLQPWQAWRCLLLALALASCRAAAAPAPASGVAVATNSRELYVALGDSQTTTIYLTQSLALNGTEWSPPLYIERNVTVQAHPALEAIASRVALDAASLVARVYIGAGAVLAFRSVELSRYALETGQAMLLVGPSPGGRVVFDRAVLRRQAGLSGQRNLADLQALPRLAGVPGNQVAFYLPTYCYNTTSDTQGRCQPDAVYCVSLAAGIAPARSSYYAPSQPLGSYDLVMADTVIAVDYLISADCLQTRLERDCAIALLRQLDTGPIIIKSRPADSNLVKIVAALAILAVAMVLFLYFRRHYRTHQEKRARRLRRIKEALGLGAGPEAPGVVFSGLEGEEPDWQLMPMPVGYATDEAEDLNEQQGQDLRQLIKDISNRPNRQRPGEGADPEDAQREVGPCPTAGEDGLQPGSAGGAAGGMPNGVHPSSPAATADHASGSTVVGGGGAAGLVAAMNSVSGGMASSGQGASEGAGSGRLHVTTNRNVTSPTAAGGGTGSPSGQVATAVVHMPLGGMTAAGAAAVAVGQAQLAGQGGTPRLGAVQPAVLTLTTMGRHQQQHQPVHGQCGSPVPAAAAAAAMLEGARQRAQGGSPNVEVTLAAAGPGGTLAAGTLTERGEAPRVPATGITALAVAGAGVSPGPGRGPASRHAATYAAVDVAQRVMRSKDSDSEGRDTAAQRAQVGDLMDELEELRRDIMAGINDTQLQIMSVVGSGAFGTVYRGQWQGLEVAVKTVVFSASSENRKRALQEAALCQSINHRNIVATYAVDVQPLGAVNTPLPLGGAGARNSTLQSLLDWRLYIVQEYCDGGPLRKLVQSQYLRTESGPNVPVICEVALELAQALAHLHSKNIIHGDLNPNNVLLKRDATSPIGFRVKMADFGLSVMVPIQKTHMSNLRLGTLYYIAPETCFRGQLGYAADVFSLGVMLWELYHGRLAGTRTPQGEPRYQPDFPDFPPACPPDYRKLAHRCLQKQPHNRLHSSQVVQRLQEMLATYRAVAAVSSPGPPLPPLPIGGPEEVVAPVPPSPAHALATALTRGNAAAPTGAPTPDESRHSNRTGPTATLSSGSRCSSAHQHQHQQQPGAGTASPVHSPPRLGPGNGLSREIVPVSEDSGGSGAAGQAAAAAEGPGRAGGGSGANGSGPGEGGGGWAMLGFLGRKGPGRAVSSVPTAAGSPGCAGAPGVRPGARV